METTVEVIMIVCKDYRLEQSSFKRTPIKDRAFG